MKHICFSCTFFLITLYFTLKTFYPIFTANEIIINYGIHPFDICTQNPILWNIIKILYFVSFTFSNFVFSNFIFSKILKIIHQIISKHKNSTFIVKSKNKHSHSNLYLVIGMDESTNITVCIPESGLYQNFLITGTIGSGKTSSAMYPFTNQLLKFNSNNKDKKIGMLILDVKGNYYKQVLEYSKKYNLEDDIIVISLNSGIFYNPLHKPNLKPQILANRLKTILLLFSENNTESYWLDKSEEILTEFIKFCRLYNDGYVTFLELHKLISIPNYYKEKLKILKNLFMSNKLSHSEIYELNSCLNFIQNDFENLDSRTKSILISEISRITHTFISDYDVTTTFCPPKEKLSFSGFSDVLKYGKIVVLNLNISEYSSLSKIIAAYLKLDFQSEVLFNLSNNICYTSAFICDEYDKYVTKSDSDFFSLSREAKCINIISTQSYSSLRNSLKDDYQVKVITQNLINKIWFRTDDIYTIEDIQKQIGKIEKEKISKSISENAKETHFNYITNTLNSDSSSISETYNTYLQNEYIYETNFFTQNLETFTALTFLSDGNKIYEPKKLKMFPYFKKNN